MKYKFLINFLNTRIGQILLKHYLIKYYKFKKSRLTPLSNTGNDIPIKNAPNIDKH